MSSKKATRNVALALVHLLLSWSLLIVQDEFERIMYIVSKILLLIIHLLCAVACVAVSNLLVFLHKSNHSICHSAIVSYLKKERVRQFQNTSAGIMIALFCSVLLTAVNSL